MRKIFALLVLVGALGMITPQRSQAQERSQVMTKGTSIVDVGIGLGGIISPFVGYEYGLTDKIGPGMIGIGASVSVLFYPSYFGYGGGVGFGGGPEANYHFQFDGLPRNLDLYAGLGLYFYSGSYYASSLFPGYHIGARYFFSDRIGATLILGGGAGFGASIGISFKL